MIKECFWNGNILTICYNLGANDIWERFGLMYNGNGEPYLSY